MSISAFAPAAVICWAQRSRPNRRVPAPPRPHSPLESGRRACGTQPGGFWAWTVACALDPKRTDCAAPQHSRPGPIGSRTCCSNTARRAALATSCHHFCSSGSVLTYPLTCKSNVITSRGVTTLPRGTGKLHTEKQPVVPLDYAKPAHAISHIPDSLDSAGVLKIDNNL